ncbi:MAG TPA: NUDIX hydrolase [Ohtaekwangia sp.]|nr:NUDIX hydrolase [Ohtaekwangia sp.]
MDSEIAKTYGNQVRVRVCGLCRENDRLLMVNHRRITPTDFWAPPGGGVDFGQSVPETLKREFLEETHLEIAVGTFAFGCEYINAPIHSIELFFEVHKTSGNLRTGHDPELQIISDVAFLSPAEIRSMSPDILHGIFRRYTETAQLKDLRGFYRI